MSEYIEYGDLEVGDSLSTPLIPDLSSKVIGTDKHCFVVKTSIDLIEVCKWGTLLKKYFSVSSAHSEQILQPQQQTYDTVAKPKHYMLFEDKGIEVRDLMSLLATRLQAGGYSAMMISDYIQAMQYLLRFDQKNGKEDIKKAQWYLDKVQEEMPE